MPTCRELDGEIIHGNYIWKIVFEPEDLYQILACVVILYAPPGIYNTNFAVRRCICNETFNGLGKDRQVKTLLIDEVDKSPPIVPGCGSSRGMD